MASALTSPATARNRDPILAVLRRVLPKAGTVLEVASGAGEHAVHFAAALPGLQWQPTDRDPEALASISARRASAGLPNLLPPFLLDAASPSWPASRADAIVAINMIHIAPWSAAEGLLAGAARLLPETGVLALYGPYREGGRDTTASNAAFDASLRERNPEWGVRDLEAVESLAGRQGFALRERIAMPANNLTLVFGRRAELA